MIDILADFNNDDRRSTFSCDTYDVCKALKDVSIRLNVDEVFVVAGAGNVGNSERQTSQILSGINCEEKFPECVIVTM